MCQPWDNMTYHLWWFSKSAKVRVALLFSGADCSMAQGCGYAKPRVKTVNWGSIRCQDALDNLTNLQDFTYLHLIRLHHMDMMLHSLWGYPSAKPWPWQRLRTCAEEQGTRAMPETPRVACSGSFKVLAKPCDTSWQRNYMLFTLLSVHRVMHIL